MGIENVRDKMVQNNIIGPNSALDKDTDEAVAQAGRTAAANSGVSAAMSALTQSVIANQIAHGINKALLSNTKTISQQYLSIA